MVQDYIGFLQPKDPMWNKLIGQIPHDFFHLPGYLLACANHEKGDGLLFTINTQRCGMVVPIIKKSLSVFGSEFDNYYDASSPYGYPGPICWGENWPGLVSEMDKILEEKFKQANIVTLFLRLNPFVGISSEHMNLKGTFRKHGPTVYLDLKDEYQSWKAINPRLRTTIALMLRKGCEVRFDEWDTLDTVIEAYYESMKRLGASEYYYFSKDFFIALMKNTIPHFHLCTSYDPNGNITGGVFFSEVNGLIQYFLTGTFNEYKELSPSKILINSLRLWGLEHGHHTLHLGGGLGGQTENLFMFKSRFSKSLATFLTHRKIIIPEYYKRLAGEKSEIDAEGFFPKYRKPQIQNIC
jgi:hypothetical protein